MVYGVLFLQYFGANHDEHLEFFAATVNLKVMSATANIVQPTCLLTKYCFNLQDPTYKKERAGMFRDLKFRS